jgi:hypothetical protein
MTQSILSHLKSRHLNIELHRPIVDEENGIATLLLYNLSGQIVGYQQYNPKGDKKTDNSKATGKYYTYKSKQLNTVVLWGVESLYQSNGVIYLTEGIYDAARLTNRGQSALATLTNNPPKDYLNYLKLLNRPIVVVCDNDNAGKKLAKYGDYVEDVPSEYKDLGESPESYVSQLIEKYAHIS